MKMLEKMEKIEVKDLPVKAKIRIPPPIHTGKETLQMTNANLGYGDKTIVSQCHIRLERGDRDIDEARQLGIGGVPFFVIDQRYAVSGAQPVEVFSAAIERAWNDESA